MLLKAIVFAALFIISYLIGSINSAIIVGKLFNGDDIRSHGSGNAGATNALRTYGVKAAVFVTVGDCLKSAICCIVAMLVSKLFLLGELRDISIYIAGIGAVLGHNFPIFFGFKGGKGILVSVTAFMFADWRISIVVLIIALILIALTKYVSLGSVAGALMFIIAAFLFRFNDIYYIIFSLILGLLAIFRHRENIKRLIEGKESKIGSKKKE